MTATPASEQIAANSRARRSLSWRGMVCGDVKVMARHPSGAPGRLSTLAVRRPLLTLQDAVENFTRFGAEFRVSDGHGGESFEVEQFVAAVIVLPGVFEGVKVLAAHQALHGVGELDFTARAR